MLNYRNILINLFRACIESDFIIIYWQFLAINKIHVPLFKVVSSCAKYFNLIKELSVIVVSES